MQKPITDKQIEVAARAIANRHANTARLSPEQFYEAHEHDLKLDARAALEAVDLPPVAPRICNTCHGTGVLKAHNWASGKMEDRECHACSPNRGAVAAQLDTSARQWLLKLAALKRSEILGGTWTLVGADTSLFEQLDEYLCTNPTALDSESSSLPLVWTDERIKAAAHRLWLLEGQGLRKQSDYEEELRSILAGAPAEPKDAQERSDARSEPTQQLVAPAAVPGAQAVASEELVCVPRGLLISACDIIRRAGYADNCVTLEGLRAAALQPSTQQQAVPNALRPDFTGIEDMRVGEMTPAQRDDSKELWLRNNLGWMQDYYLEHLTFLLRRLDEARTLAKAGQPSGDEAQALRDMLDDARAELDMVRKALGVADEPHQSLTERTLQAAQKASQTAAQGKDTERLDAIEAGIELSRRHNPNSWAARHMFGPWPTGAEFQTAREAIDFAVKLNQK